MTKRMLIDAAHLNETRVVILEDDRVQDYDFVTTSKTQLKGNIYLAKITRVEPSLQAAFVEYGGGKQGFLPFSEIHPDYYQLPAEDKRKLLEEQIAEAEAEAAAEDEAFEREQAAREARRQGGQRGDTQGTDEETDADFVDAVEIHVEAAQEHQQDLKATEAALAATESPLAPLPEVAELPHFTAESLTESPLLSDAPEPTSSQPMRAQAFAVQSDVIVPEPEASAPVFAELVAEAHDAEELTVPPFAGTETTTVIPPSEAEILPPEDGEFEAADDADDQDVESETGEASEASTDGERQRGRFRGNRRGGRNRNRGARTSDETEQSADAENTASEDEEDDQGGRGFYRRYRIQEVIKRNQIVLVQVIKEERGNKGCSLTTFISLAGRCAVLMPNSPKGGGISRKITDRETRRRLKEIAAEMRTHRGMSVIIRTAGLDRTKSEIRRDFEYLVTLWNEVREQTLASVAPALIYEEGSIIKRSLRDLYTGDIEEVIIEGQPAFEEAKNFMRMLMPSHAARIKLYKEMTPLFSYAGIEEQLLGMTEPQVKLPSGGYLVINPTEALISIDVNSGRSTTERNVEETALKTNLEAAAEVARQLRLRDLAGLIVIDFIDMNYGKNRKAVERALKDALRHDRAKIQLGRISMFGLMELSRQRMRPSIAESMGIMCPHCRGSGYIHSVETVAIQIIRTLEREAASGDFVTLRVTTQPEAALHLLNQKRGMIQAIEARHDVSILILPDSGLATGTFRLIKVNEEGKEILHDEGNQSARNRGGRRGRRGGQGGGNSPRERGRLLDFTDAVEISDEEPYVPEAEEDEEPISRMGSVVEAEDEDAEETSTSERTPREGRERNRDRGGRNRRGGRDRDRNRDRNRADRPEGDAVTDPSVATEGDLAETSSEGATDENASPETRERNRRGRRGGRNRNRDRRPREGQSEEGSSQESRPSHDTSADAPAMPYRSESVTEPAPAPVTAPKPARVVALSEAQTNPTAITSPIVSQSTETPKEKRKGWWSRVLES